MALLGKGRLTGSLNLTAGKSNGEMTTAPAWRPEGGLGRGATEGIKNNQIAYETRTE